MSTRSRPPTDKQRTNVFERGARGKPLTQRGVPKAADLVELATPTEVSPPFERSEPLRVISMKDPAERGEKREAVPVQVKLRPLSDVSGRVTPPSGHLAPPRDPREVRARRLRETIVWGSLVVIVASAVTLAIWLLAR